MRVVDDSWFVQRRELLRTVQSLPGGVVQLSAPRGYGKTTVLQQVVKHATDLGLLLNGRSLRGADSVADAVVVGLRSQLSTAPPESADTGGQSELLDLVQAEIGDRRLLLAVDEIVEADPCAQRFLVELVQRLPQQVRLVVAAREPWDEPYAYLSSDIDMLLIDADQLLISRRELEGIRSIVRTTAARDMIFEDTQGWPAAIPAAVGRAVGTRWAHEEHSKLCDFINRSILGGLSDDQYLLLQTAVRAEVAIPLKLFSECGDAPDTWSEFPLLARQGEPYPGIRPVGLLQEGIFRKSAGGHDAQPAVVFTLAECLCELERFVDAARVAELIAPAQVGELVLYLGPALVTQGNDQTAYALFDRFTSTQILGQPTLVLARAVMSALRGDTREAHAWLRDYGTHQVSQKNASGLGRLLLTLTQQLLLARPASPVGEVDPTGWTRLLGHLITSFGCYQQGDEESALHYALAVFRTSDSFPLMRILAAAFLAYLHLRRGQVADADRVLTVARGLAAHEGLGHMNSTVLIDAVAAWVAFATRDEKVGRGHVEQAIRKLEPMADGIPFLMAISQISLIEAALVSADPRVREEVAGYVAAARDPIGGRTGNERQDLLVKLSDSLPNVRQTSPLTRSETLVLHHLTSHLSLPQIANQLHLSPATVRSHAHSIYRKFGVNSRAEAVSEARRLLLIPPP